VRDVLQPDLGKLRQALGRQMAERADAGRDVVDRLPRGQLDERLQRAYA
jgi:hypothetical protein